MLHASLNPGDILGLLRRRRHSTPWIYVGFEENPANSADSHTMSTCLIMPLMMRPTFVLDQAISIIRPDE